MLKFLNKPYPRRNETLFWLPIVLMSGLMVSVILFFVLSFQNNLSFSAELIRSILLFGLVTIVIMSFTHLLLPFIFKNFFSEERWTVGKNILMWMLLLVLIAIGNTWLANGLYGSSFSLKSFSIFLYYTIGIGFIINTFFTAVNYRRLTKRNTTDAAVLNTDLKSHNTEEKKIESAQEKPIQSLPDTISITSENEKENLEIALDELLYIESADNYSRIFCHQKNKETSFIIRSSLKRIEMQANHPAMFRCHRAYIVNLKKVTSVSGNSQGYQLQINGTDKSIPVSRNFGPALSEKLKQLS